MLVVKMSNALKTMNFPIFVEPKVLLNCQMLACFVLDGTTGGSTICDKYQVEKKREIDAPAKIIENARKILFVSSCNIPPAAKDKTSATSELILVL